MRPEAPVPGTVVRSTLFSEAILRTSGEERGRSPAEAAEAAAARRGWCRSGRGSLRGSGCRSCWLGGGSSSASADDGDDRVDADRRAFGDLDLGERAGDRRGNLGVNLVGRDFEDGLVALNGVADLLEPLGDGALGDGLAHLRHHDLGAGACSGATGGSESFLLGLFIAHGGVNGSGSNSVFLRRYRPRACRSSGTWHRLR